MATTPPRPANIQHTTHTLSSEPQQHAQVVPAAKTRHQPLPAAAMGPEQLREPPQKGRRVELKVEDAGPVCGWRRRSVGRQMVCGVDEGAEGEDVGVVSMLDLMMMWLTETMC